MSMLRNALLLRGLFPLFLLIASTPSSADDGASGRASPVPLAQERVEAVKRSAQLLRERYLDAGLGEKLAQGLLAQEEAGAFARASTPQEFAAAMTAAMQGIVPDLHLRLAYVPGVEFAGPGAAVVAPGSAGAGGQQVVRRSSRIDPRDAEAIARSNFGFEAVQRLAGNVGYLRLTRFVPLELSRPTASAALAMLSNSDAVIIDLRGNIGGAPESMGFLMSHLLSPSAQPIVLHASENRAMKMRSEIASDPTLGNARLAGAPLYLVVDKESASAAEMMAYTARRIGRGKVVGETTSGAGNGGRNFSVGGGFALFLAEWKVLTGPGWERVGVAPDVAVAPADAVALAHKLALQELLKSAPPAPDIRAERLKALERL